MQHQNGEYCNSCSITKQFSEREMSKCNDSWTGMDKVKHFCVCFVLAAICPIVAVVVAIAKEVHDERTEGNHWCWKDIVADAVGVALGSAVHFLLKYLLM